MQALSCDYTILGYILVHATFPGESPKNKKGKESPIIIIISCGKKVV